MSRYMQNTPQLLLSRRLSLLLLLLLIFICCSAFTSVMPEFTPLTAADSTLQQQSLKLSLQPIYTAADLRPASPVAIPEKPAPEPEPEPTPEPEPEPEPQGTPLAVPAAGSANTGFKSYMDYRTLTNRRSRQYAMQQQAYTDEQGFRIYDGCYMVALGTYYAQSVGQRFRITLADGRTFMAITGDIKSDAHTDPKHQHRHGNIVEFIVDQRRISATCRRMGDMSYAGFSGAVVSIEKF